MSVNSGHFCNIIRTNEMSSDYTSPRIDVIDMGMISIICLSLTGTTEGLDNSDLEDIIIDDPFTL